MNILQDRPIILENWLPDWIGRSGCRKVFMCRYCKPAGGREMRSLFLEEIKDARNIGKVSLYTIRDTRKLLDFDFEPYRETNTFIYRDANGELLKLAPGMPEWWQMKSQIAANGGWSADAKIAKYDMAAVAAVADAFTKVYRQLYKEAGTYSPAKERQNA